MLTIGGKARGGFCDGVSRRDFLRIGGLGLGGLALPQLLRAEALAGSGTSHKAVIMVCLAGGPPHQDMVDLKPDAPEEVRGEFKPIATNVPGIDICEHLPRLARLMDRLVVIRSIVGARGEHALVQCTTGYSMADSTQAGGRPSLGSILSTWKARCAATCRRSSASRPATSTPPGATPASPATSGLQHAAFTPNGSDLENMTLKGISLDRFADRKSLLASFDGLRRDDGRRTARSPAWTPSPSGPSTS